MWQLVGTTVLCTQIKGVRSSACSRCLLDLRTQRHRSAPTKAIGSRSFAAIKWARDGQECTKNRAPKDLGMPTQHTCAGPAHAPAATLRACAHNGTDQRKLKGFERGLLRLSDRLGLHKNAQKNRAPKDLGMPTFNTPVRVQRMLPLRL